ncbi:cystinosin isoform X2 [Narcine bancroftii]|uniref:cystinosin isoform X2 n=1 Tax=Narcine bancroftii TaxID=1343680 RepID=UPI003831537E
MELLTLLVPLCLFRLTVQDQTTMTLKAPEIVDLEIGSLRNVSVTPSEPPQETLFVTFNVMFSSKQTSVIELPENITLSSHSTNSTCFQVKGVGIGRATVLLETAGNRSNNVTRPLARINFVIMQSSALSLLSEVVGWIYFLAWSVSFYPQVVENWRRKSVIGLNFDFLALNLTGHIAYGVYNIGLFWILDIKIQFQKSNPGSVNPVGASDVFFSLHAILLTVFTICQCFLYERGEQRVSKVTTVILVALWLFGSIILFVAIADKVSWLQYLYYISYIKLVVTLIKYIPQAYMNHRRKSTVGWSIGNVLLDFTGGSFSILQMFLQSYNNVTQLLTSAASM